MNRSVRPVWLVTGAAGALGRALVSRVLALGDDCIALDRNERGLNRLHDQLAAVGEAPALYPMDLAGAGPDDYAQLALVVEERFGRLDVLVHAAAYFSALRPLEHQPADEWFTTLQVGLTGPQLLTSALMPLLRAGERGTIALINNTDCLEKPARWGAYGICQAGRRQMAATLSAELGPRGPRTMEIDPGPFFSPLRSAAWPTDTPGDLPNSESAAAQIQQRIQTGVM
ncbi:SDR family NAD(P)-dependent oxidoreductase [Wenzhouxiangella limi]|uniref:SDR family NAD(P)-dependent oxidoreductase n=1 Tax=Wenzhouxiangella limi TaxID=2707351 RepID=A0A845US87_9GAMM|nr:SDR family NAD(P)-dependent oxidoreductase [Wenzhouxiangella limi]NDY94703.1 SDR family NAD(P)-dependent oxidoreductase [Wenzhouxiangella limi]